MQVADCIFCKIVRNEIPNYTVYEDGDTRAFLDIFGTTDGHTVVILKKHGETIHDYDAKDLGKLWSSVQKVAAALEKTYRTGILSIGINHGEPRGVHHLHVHVMPRYEGDGGGIMQSLPARKQTTKDFAGIAANIRANLV